MDYSKVRDNDGVLFPPDALPKCTIVNISLHAIQSCSRYVETIRMLQMSVDERLRT